MKISFEFFRNVSDTLASYHITTRRHNPEKPDLNHKVLFY